MIHKWFRAAGLFENTRDGTEQLSPTGRQEIDRTVAPVLDGLPNQPIIVEGYSLEGSPSQQFVTSRIRAQLVRRYLETRYHLNHRNVGIVAMRTRPPEDAGVGEWDGAVIVIANTAKSDR
jgi:hypothetical protein